MSSAANQFGNPAGTIGTLNGFFKETYANKLEELIPDGVKILNKIKFMSKEKMPGNLFHQPVILGLEHGITFASSDEDAFNLNPPIAGSIKDAQVKGNPAILRSVLGDSAASRAAQGTAQSFMDATKFLVANMLRSMAKKLEIEMLYGQMGYAVVQSIASNVVTITTSEWAPGIWAGGENMPIEFRDTTGATSRGECQVASVDLTAQTITLASIPAGITGGGLGVGDVIWHKGAYGNEFVGIHKILTITSGTLFNINVGTYNLFKGNTYSAAGGALSFTKLNNAAALAVEKGQDGTLYCLVNVRAWSNMLSDQAALRRYDGSYSKDTLNQGAKTLSFHSQNGELEIEPSIYVKQGYAYLISADEWMRVGSSDMSFKRPGHNDEYFRPLENSAGSELRLFTDQALFCSAPGRNVLISGITNSL